MNFTDTQKSDGTFLSGRFVDSANDLPFSAVQGCPSYVFWTEYSLKIVVGRVAWMMYLRNNTS